jgi:hypothetical protein
VAHQGFEREFLAPEDEIEEAPEQNHGDQRRQPADRTARSLGRLGACGHPRYIHERQALTLGLTAL